MIAAARFLPFALALLLVGCATVSFETTSPRILAGSWTAIGPEFQDYDFKVVMTRGEPRLTSEPQSHFKDESAKKQYTRKYGELVRTADAFDKAVNSLAEIAAIGGPTHASVDRLDQAWDPRKGELVWIRSHYQVVGGKRDNLPLYEDVYQLHFDSALGGTMLFDGKPYDLVRPGGG